MSDAVTIDIPPYAKALTDRIAALEAGREHAEYLITNKQNAVNAYVDRVQLLEGLLARERQCSTCCGTPHASGLTCICGGTNSHEEEVKGLRLAAMNADSPFSCEFVDALDAWRGLTEEQREMACDQFVTTMDVGLDGKPMAGRANAFMAAMRLLKAAAR